MGIRIEAAPQQEGIAIKRDDVGTLLARVNWTGVEQIYEFLGYLIRARKCDESQEPPKTSVVVDIEEVQ